VLAASRIHPLNVEGLSLSQWILVDFADVVVHVFRHDMRGHYGLEKLWSDAKRVRIPSERSAPAVAVPSPAGRPARVRDRR
jgi:ribosome-associated protein